MALHYEAATMIAQVLGIDRSLLMDEYTEFCKPGYGKRIKAIRIQVGATQQEFADMIGCLRSTESVWEEELYGRRPNRESFQKLKQLATENDLDIQKLIDDPNAYIDEYADFVESDCGKKIRQIRLAHGVVNHVFAEMIGCDWQTLVHWEIDITRPLRKYFDAIKQAAIEVGIDLDMLNKDPGYFISDYQGFVASDCGAKIQSIRMAHGCGLNQFGRLLGCTGEAVANWEKNICTPELKYYKKIEQIALEKGISIKSLNQAPIPIKDEYKDFCEKEYGQKVREVRRFYNMTQKDFSLLIGVSLSTIGGWENGRVVPDRDHYKKLKAIAARKGMMINDT